MLEVPFKISASRADLPQSPYIRFSLPIKKGQLWTTQHLAIKQLNQFLPNTDFTVLAQWPDHSIKWLSCHFTKIENMAENFALVTTQEPQNQELSSIAIESEQQHLCVRAATTNYRFQRERLSLENIALSIKLSGKDSQYYNEFVTTCRVNQGSRQVSTTLDYCGVFKDINDDLKAEYQAQFEVFSQHSLAKLEVTIKNPKAMAHHGGKWDLGNENSLFFKYFNIELGANPKSLASVQFTPTQNASDSANEFTLYQASSGGENWQSKNHVNANNQVTLPFQGFEYSGESKTYSGKRAEPVVALQQKQYLAVYLENFWQNFPKSINKNDTCLKIGLFPEQHHELHELLPGEQKTHTLWISLDPSINPAALANSAQVIISPEYYQQTNVLPFFTNNKNPDQIDHLIQQGLKHENNFFTKREQIDEYGWRNFGDIYADHETLEYQGEHPLISHYNNQYDPLYGFLRQYLHSGDTQWLTLANDLASHIKDIDIYHTNQDKPQYNNGLFWHTDHYLPAETAGHRTYSKYQDANAYQDHAGGGGPAGQHCYTTGLMLHYFVTGNESSKQAVIDLAHWVMAFYEGDGSFFETLLSVKNSRYGDYKNVVTGQYPLDRGTGNYIVALLDAYEVSGKQSYLDQASLVIKHTAFPCEDIEQRGLDDVEATWFYTVFLQAVCRYLHTKESVSQLDESYRYSQATLVNFARWMAVNEQPYLTKPSILEYPNHTWAAQDIRKANILYFASRYQSDETKQQMLNKAEQIYQYVGTELSEEKTHYFTRILCILMQNHGIKHYALDSRQQHCAIEYKLASALTEDSLPEFTKKAALKLLIKRLAKSSLKKEVNWLRKRVSKFDQLLKAIAK